MTVNRADLLLDLAAGWRPDWDRDQISQALVAARFAEWTPDHTLGVITQLLRDPKAKPHDLAVAARKPFERTEPARPGVAEAALAEMRAAVQHAGGAS